MWLLIDDERNLDVDVIARTPEAGRYLMRLAYRGGGNGWECICFDHDLGARETGYDLLVWGIENRLLPNRIQLVTSNPVGRKRMRQALEREGYKTIDGTNFRK